MSNYQASLKRLQEKLARECGKVIMHALHDPNVIEIMLNPDGRLWLDIVSKGICDTGERIDALTAENILATCASMLHSTITYENPIIEGEFPLDGSRLEGLIYPAVTAPAFSIRKKASKIFTLNEYKKLGIIQPLTPSLLTQLKGFQKQSNDYQDPIQIIYSAIKAKKNMVIAGGTGSGKTTLANAILDSFSKLCPNERVITIEDTRELQINIRNIVSLRTTENIDMQRLLRATMRLRPDRIIVGEVRGKEALALLKAWNTGHPGGIATLHADSAYGALIRLEQLIEENPGIKANPKMIAEAVKLIIFIEGIPTKPGRLVSDIVEVRGFKNGEYQLKSILLAKEGLINEVA